MIEREKMATINSTINFKTVPNLVYLIEDRLIGQDTYLSVITSSIVDDVTSLVMQ